MVLMLLVVVVLEAQVLLEAQLLLVVRPGHPNPSKPRKDTRPSRTNRSREQPRSAKAKFRSVLVWEKRDIVPTLKVCTR